MSFLVDRLLVVAGSLVVVVGLGLAMRRTAEGDALRVPLGTPLPPVRPAPPAAGPGATPAGDLLDWSLLTSYEYVDGLVGLPSAVKALDGRPVVMKGFLSVLYQFDDIDEFILVANHMSCCFGMPAGISGQVQVKLSGGRTIPNTNEPLEVRGTLRIVETKEAGYILSMYRIDDARVRIVGYR